jgi:hypothetical protein
MAIRPGHAYLALLQRAAYARIGNPPPTFDPDELRGRGAANAEALRDGGPFEQELEAKGLDAAKRRAILERLRQGNTQVGTHHDLEKVLAAARNAPTPYVDPFHHAILSKLDGRIANLGRRQPEHRFASALRNLRGRVIVSTLLMGQVNARTLSVPGTDDYLIVFDPVFFDFLYCLSTDIACAIDGDKALQGARQQASASEQVPVSPAIRFGDAEVTRRFLHTMSAFLRWGLPPPPQPYDEKSFDLAQHLREIATLFILAHEYAHLLLGHVSAPRASGPQSDAAQQPTAFQQELEAGWLACSLLDAILARRRVSRATQFMGVHFFFVATMLAELGVRAIETGKPRQLTALIPRDETELGDTHPVALLRMASVNQWLARKFPQHLARSNEYLEALLLEVASRLWDNVQRHVLDMRAKGFEGPALWKSLDVFEGPPLEAPASDSDEGGAVPHQRSQAGDVPRCPRCGQKINMERYGPQRALHIDAVRDECPDCNSLLLISLADSSVIET